MFNFHTSTIFFYNLQNNLNLKNKTQNKTKQNKKTRKILSMFDLVCIFTTGGVILFYKAFCVLKFDILDFLIKKVLLQEKSSENSYSLEPYTVKWRLVNDFNLIITAVYQELFHLTYVEELLELVKDNYVKTMIPTILIHDNIFRNIPNFEEKFDECMKKWEDQKRKSEKKASLMRSFEETKKTINKSSELTSKNLFNYSN